MEMEVSENAANEVNASSPSALFSDHRLVHLDLKGAPPKLSYYEKFFPLVSHLGATGLLVEYEDMFPYSGKLQDIAAPNAYSRSEIGKLRGIAAENNLTVIPLVQTFGHFEFVLKHDKFRHLREVSNYPLTLCPLQADSLAVVTAMIDQVIELHQGLEYFHIGADEVFHLGLCSRCNEHMSASGLSKEQMFFAHIQRVLEHIRDKHPGIKAIMWDDMYRSTDLEALRGSGLADLVQPMVWEYRKQLSCLPSDLWERYSKVFSCIWVASAFKGATGPRMFTTAIGYHVENHREWLRVIKSSIRPNFSTFAGICLTGWQRYDHYSVLCELLPVGLPSLAMCLLLLKYGTFTEEVHREASTELNFKELIPLSLPSQIGTLSECEFPGSDVYVGVQHLLQLKEDFKLFMKNDRLHGWMTEYHVKHRFGNPAHINHFLPQGQQLLEQFRVLQSSMQVALKDVFYPDAVDEWLACNITHRIGKLEDIIKDAEELRELGAKPKQYSNGFPTEQTS